MAFHGDLRERHHIELSLRRGANLWHGLPVFVPKNYMFIGTMGDRFPFRIEKLGGVRVIL